MGFDSRIAICDIILPEPNTIFNTQEARVRALDLTMLSMFNAKERSYRGWKVLCTSADSRLNIIAMVDRSKMGTDNKIEVRLV